MVTFKKKEEIIKLREGGKILAEILQNVAHLAKPGISTARLNEIAEELIKKFGARPSFKNFRSEKNVPPYPATLCTSINDEIVHCVPSQERILKDGDILGLDLGIWYKNFCTDSAFTVAIGEISKEAQKLISTTEESLYKGIKEAVVGNTIGDIGFVISQYVQQAGFSVIRDLVGHGVGYGVHEDPQIPNFGQKGQGEKLKVGMVLAIEPMTTIGDYHIKSCSDHFGYRTSDGSLSAHFEHTIAITENDPEILTKL
ncbi:MAG: Methionine aminopeptidase [Parcubacteria group bacterium GW2011_GWC1_38_17]|nr:MAG: Methionine aminopeptidase [Parcubacteria group bacterium GW2011_GWC2_36_17]KKQ42287.1 MAG: Methionine aminopeptidase [Parcubacteria group bacterium GW2011_GWE2_37_8]KKQ58233.1 MAG: Methionine aminopeptidase [Parcubacteria group bacterium GW2011_GWD1_38_16]KKQ58898.1 MAG: Methionine aminopeptidase [Parcubacteria group bacterium GW2011_GWC1_38_17]